MYQPIIELKKPCSEKLEDRKPGSKGNFCNSCKIVVVDFTNYTPEEISSYLMANGSTHCGTFKREDINTGSRVEKFISYLQSRNLKFAAVVLLSFLLLLSCRIRRGKVSNGPIFNNKQNPSIEHLK